MQLAGTLASLVSIEQRELRTATLMLAHSFAMGLTTVFFETAASALFLSHFESSALPWVYLAAAATSAVTGIVYTSLLGRVAFRRLMLGTLGFLALTTVALRVGLWLTPAGGLLFAVLVWYRVISILTDLEYWAVAARMYDVRQAKRLYPFIGSGEVVARIAGAFSVPIFLGYMGVENLLLLSAAAAAACMGLLGLALRGRNVDSAPGSKSKQENKWGLLEPLRAVTKTPYLRLLVSIAFFAVLGKYFVDFAFLAEMRGRFTGVKELASAFAIFSGVSQSLSLLTRVFVAGRVLNRYGVKAGLLVLPIAHLACTVLLVISGVTPGLALLVFWFAIGNQGLYKTLKHPIDNPSFKLLYQPLAKDERLKTQVAVETIVTPIGIAIAGAVMLQFSVLIPYDPVTFALALAMAFAGWVFFARQAGRAYAGALVEALRGRVEDIDDSFDDERNLPVLKETLASGRPPEVLFALDLLEKSSHRADQLEPLLIGLLDHASPDVRISALLRIEQHAMRSAAPSILERLDTEQSPAVTGALLRALGGTIGGGEYEARVSRHLTHADPQIRMGAIIGLLRNGKAGRHLETLAASPNIAERAFAARAIGETRLPHLAPMLEPLLDDESTEVRRAALLAAGRLGASAPWKRVIECLDDRALTGSATSALVTGGAAPLSHLTESFHPGVSPRRLQRIARVLGRRSDAAAAEILFFRIDFPNEIVRHEVLDSLSACAFQAQPNRRATIDECLEREAQDAAAKLAALHAVADTDLQLLRSALESELIRSQDRLTLLLEYIYDREAMELVKENRTHESREKRAYALEVLDVTIETEHKKMLMPLLEGRLSPPLRGDAGRASMDRMPYILLVAFAALFGASASPAEDSLYAQALVRVADGDSVPIPRVDPPTPASEDAEDEECAEDDDDCDDDEKETKVYWKDGETHFDMEGAHITLANRIQVRYSHLFPDDDLRLPGTTERGQSKGSFRIRRAKTTFEGWFWKPELTFELQLNWAEPEPGASTDRPLEDGYINWDASKRGAFMVRVGQFKVPFGRQEMTTSSGLQFVDRSILTFEFTRGRDIGLQFHGRIANDKLEYRAGIFNGNPASRIENDNAKFQYNVHLSYQPFGEVKYREPDFESGDKPLLAIEGEFEHNDLHGSTNATDLKTVIWGAALVFKYKGFSLFSEYFARERTPEEGDAWDSPGFIVQSGYFLKRDKLEVALRYATWDPNQDIDNITREELGIAVNYYFLQHRFKLMGDFRELRNQDRDSKDQELRIQTQFMF